jgi:hypothetical protein
MSGGWFYVPPDIEGWHEEGYEIRDRATNEVVCRDCRSEGDANMIVAAPKLLEAAKAIRDSRPDYVTVEERRQLVRQLNAAIDGAEAHE